MMVMAQPEASVCVALSPSQQSCRKSGRDIFISR